MAANQLMLGKQEIVNDVVSQERTEIDVVEESVVKNLPNKVSLKVLNPFLDDGPYDILKRSYKILDIPVFQSEVVFPPYNFLLSVPAISNAIATFRYLRADIKLQIVFTSVPQNYGCFSISWIPYPWKQGAAYTSNELMQAHAVLIDVASMDRVEYNIPFTSSEYALDLRSFILGNAICDVFVQPRFLDNLAGAPVPVEMQVWANFERPELMGPVVYQADMVNMASAALDTAAKAKKSYDMATGAGSWAYEVYETVFGEGEASNTIMKEEVKGEDGASTDVKQSIIGNVSVSSYSSQLCNLGFSNPRSVPCSLVAPEGNLMDMQTLLRRPSVFFDYTFTPSGQESINLRLNPLLTYDIGTGPLETNTYIEYISRMHRFWKGSFKLSFHFFTSPLISMRLRASVNYGNVIPGVNNVGDTPVKVMPVRGHTEYTLQVPFVYNKPLARLGTGADPDICVVNLNVESVPIGLNSAVPSVYMLVLVSCGDDFRFYSPQNMTGFDNTPPPVVKQCDVNALHSSDFEVPFEGRIIHTPDTITPTTNVLQLINRYSDRVRDVGAMQSSPIVIDSGATAINSGLYDKLAQLYRFWTGSARIKAIFPAGLRFGVSMENFADDIYFSDFTCSDGFTLVDTDVWPVLEVEIPYLNATMASPIAPPLIGTSLPDREAQLIVPAVDPTRVLIAAGKGYSLMHLLPTPLKSLW